jgi:hypothetical protein
MRQFMRIPRNRIRSKRNARSHPGDQETLLNLGHSCLKNMIHPLIVMADGPDFFELIDGWRRWLAVGMILGEDTDHLLDCSVTNEELDNVGIMCVNLISSIHREDVSVVDKWQTLNAICLNRPEIKNIDLAKMLDVHPSRITQILSVNNCSLSWQTAFVEGKVTSDDCYWCSKQPPELHDQLLLEKLKAKGARSARNGFDPAAPRRVTIPFGSGKVVVSGDWQALIDGLTDLLKNAKKAAGKASIATWAKGLAQKGKGVAS